MNHLISAVTLSHYNATRKIPPTSSTTDNKIPPLDFPTVSGLHASIIGAESKIRIHIIRLIHAMPLDDPQPAHSTAITTTLFRLPSSALRRNERRPLLAPPIWIPQTESLESPPAPSRRASCPSDEASQFIEKKTIGVDDVKSKVPLVEIAPARETDSGISLSSKGQDCIVILLPNA